MSIEQLVRFGSEGDMCIAVGDVRFGSQGTLPKRKTASRRSLPEWPLMHLGRSTRALGQARAGTKGEARLRSASGDLQRLIGNVQKKHLFLCFQYHIRHHINPFVCALAN